MPLPRPLTVLYLAALLAAAASAQPAAPAKSRRPARRRVPALFPAPGEDALELSPIPAPGGLLQETAGGELQDAEGGDPCGEADWSGHVHDCPKTGKRGGKRGSKRGDGSAPMPSATPNGAPRSGAPSGAATAAPGVAAGGGAPSGDAVGSDSGSRRGGKRGGKGTGGKRGGKEKGGKRGGKGKGGKRGMKRGGKGGSAAPPAVVAPPPAALRGVVAAARPRPTTTTVPPPPPDKCPDEMLQVLHAHNVYRCMHGLRPLQWHQYSADRAQVHANKRVYQPSPGTDRGGIRYGENLYHGSSPDGVSAVQTWYSSIRFTDVCCGLCSNHDEAVSIEAGFEDMTPYTALVWRSTTRVGCGSSRITVYRGELPPVEEDFWVCQYEEAPNILGEFSKEVAEPAWPPTRCGISLAASAAYLPKFQVCQNAKWMLSWLAAGAVHKRAEVVGHGGGGVGAAGHIAGGAGAVVGAVVGALAGGGLGGAAHAGKQLDVGVHAGHGGGGQVQAGGSASGEVSKAFGFGAGAGLGELERAAQAGGEAAAVAAPAAPQALGLMRREAAGDARGAPVARDAGAARRRAPQRRIDPAGA